MKKIVVAIPHSHTFFWTQICLASLARNPPRADGFECEVVVVDNSPWSPAILGVHKICTLLPVLGQTSVLKNYKSNKFHASALDCVVEKFDFDYLMSLETDVLACRPDWLQWFVDQARPTDFAVGAWHHEQFVNPSCTLYRGDVLREMSKWCRKELYLPFGDRQGVLHCAPQDELRWGPNFSRADPLDHNLHNAENPAEVLRNIREWVSGPFAEKRGFPEGTVLREPSSGQHKGPGWYEPGQQLHAWAVDRGYTYTVCPTLTTEVTPGLPLQTLYGAGMPDPGRQLEAVELFGNCRAAHMWGGTRALDILKHPVTCNFVRTYTPYWLAREARYWRATVPPEIQAETLELIRKWGWHTTGQGNDAVGGDARDRKAAEYVCACYAEGGVEW